MTVNTDAINAAIKAYYQRPKLRWACPAFPVAAKTVVIDCNDPDTVDGTFKGIGCPAAGKILYPAGFDMTVYTGLGFTCTSYPLTAPSTSRLNCYDGTTELCKYDYIFLTPQVMDAGTGQAYREIRLANTIAGKQDRDCQFIFPAAADMPHEIKVTGMLRFKCIGGSAVATLPWDNGSGYPSGNINGGIHGALVVTDCVVWMYFEGLKLDANEVLGIDCLESGTNVNANARPSLYIQNCRNVGANSLSSSYAHSDCFQPQSVYDMMYIDRFTGLSRYQVAFLDVQNATTGRIFLSNIECAPTDTVSAYLLYLMSTGSHGSVQSGNPYVIPVSMENIYVADTPGRTWENQQVAPPQSSGTWLDYIRGVYVDPYMSWPTIPQYTGKVRRGKPPGGEMVRAADVGPGYVSPGYLNYPQAVRPTTFPIVSGTKQLGQTLTCADPIWPGNDPTTITDQWRVATGIAMPGPALAGEMAATHVIGTNDSAWVMTSTSSNSIGGGNKTFTIPSGHSYIYDQVVRAVEAGNANNYQYGNLTAVSDTSITMAVNTHSSVTGTSTTSNTIGTGALTFVVSGLVTASPGDAVTVQETADNTNFVTGTVTTFDGTNLVMNATSSGGSGTHTDWTATATHNVSSWNILPRYYCETHTTNSAGTFQQDSNSI